MSFKMVPIPKEKGRGWKVIIDGEERVVGQIELQSKFGTLTYGLRPEGYDGWVFREQGGGGVVTVPYSRTPDGELLVGLLMEKRANMGDGYVWCVIGGFIDPGETHKQAQVRETAEEAGLNAVTAMELAGPHTNANRAFFVADADAGEGVHASALSLPFDLLEADDSIFKLKDAAVLPGFKKAADVRFFPWRVAVGITADALARAAIAQLVAAKL
jgi:ADP-ribose pyrophosphatase YjhB (NUDIX family)